VLFRSLDDKSEFLARWEKQLKCRERDLNSRGKLLKRQELEHLEASKQIEALRSLTLQLEKRVNDLTSENSILRSKLLATGPVGTDFSNPTLNNRSQDQNTGPNRSDLDAIRIEMRDQHIDLLKTMMSTQAKQAPSPVNIPTPMYHPPPMHTFPPMQHVFQPRPPPNLGPLPHGAMPFRFPQAQFMPNNGRPPMGPWDRQAPPVSDQISAAMLQHMKTMEANMVSLKHELQSIDPLRDQLRVLQDQMAGHYHGSKQGTSVTRTQ
jgi:hypothetical protein